MAAGLMKTLKTTTASPESENGILAELATLGVEINANKTGIRMMPYLGKSLRNVLLLTAFFVAPAVITSTP